MGTSDEAYLERFMKVYITLPLSERGQVVVVINEEPISWVLAYKQIVQKTGLGKKIGEKLIELKII